MDETIKKQIQAALTQHRQQQNTEQQAAARARAERSDFENRARFKFKEEIFPAMEEVKGLLDKNGWQVQIEGDAYNMKAKIEIWKGDMRVMGQRKHPFVEFGASKSSNTIDVQSATISMSEGVKSYKLDDLDKSAVQQNIADTLTRLANGQ